MDRLSAAVEIMQLVATIALVLVAKRQAAAAVEQASAAKSQSEAAAAQVAIATRPKIIPMEMDDRGQHRLVIVNNEGQGSAYHVRWKVEEETNWTMLTQVLGKGDTTNLRIPTINGDRRIIIEYWSSQRGRFQSRLNLERFPEYEYTDELSESLIESIRRIANK
jgi:hypothetical protein